MFSLSLQGLLVSFMKKITLLIVLLLISTFSFGNMAEENFMVKTNDIDFLFEKEPSQIKDPFSVYPNPATRGFVNILSESGEPKEIFVFDVLGKEIIRTVLKGDRLDISILESGIYILKITQGQDSVTKKLIVK